MRVFLIAHTNPDGTGVAQAVVSAASELRAIREFNRRYPQREISIVAEREQ